MIASIIDDNRSGMNDVTFCTAPTNWWAFLFRSHALSSVLLYLISFLHDRGKACMFGLLWLSSAEIMATVQTLRARSGHGWEMRRESVPVAMHDNLDCVAPGTTCSTHDGFHLWL